MLEASSTHWGVLKREQPEYYSGKLEKVKLILTIQFRIQHTKQTNDVPD